MRDEDMPPDVCAWLVLFEASLKDPGNDELAATAGSFLLEILRDRGLDVRPCPPP